MRRTLILTTAFGIVMSLIGVATYSASAVEGNDPNAGQALEIAPPVLNISADPGQTINTQVKLRDVSTTRLRVTGEVNDFVAAGEDGTPKILMEEDAALAEDNPFSMKDWFGPLPSLTLNPREVEDLPITIYVPQDAAPGGYYAVIRFTATPPELEETGVSLSASLGALILLRVNGEVAEKMSIQDFGVTDDRGNSATVFESTPLIFTQRLKNEGNIHEQPTGQITVKDMFGKVIATVNINLPPRNVLPNSTRKFEQSLDKSILGNKMLFGFYSAELKVTYGEDKQIMTDKLSFWVIPYKLIGFSILGIILAFFVLRVMIRRYNQSIIRKAQGGGKRKKK